MNRQVLQKRRLPDAPGVYFFLGRNKKVLYIGRAASLRSRVQSYFASDIAEKRSSWIGKMLNEARHIEITKTHSVLEAILLEADLIKKFKPPYNTELKDDKSFNCIAITDEEFPRVLLVRSGTLRTFSLRRARFEKLSPPFHQNEMATPPPRVFKTPRLRSSVRSTSFSARNVFGPFPNSAHLKTALKIIRKIFPFRDSCFPPLKGGRGDVKPCFNRQIGLCPGVCTGEISAKEYQKHIARLALFLSGKHARIQKELERDMRASARAQEFEKAGELKRQLFALKHIQDVALLGRESHPLASLRSALPLGKGGEEKNRIEAYDLSHFGGKHIVGAMAVIENGIAQPSKYRLFKLRSINMQNEVAGLQEIICRRLKHTEWTLPHLIVVDGNKVQKKAAEKVVAEAGYRIPVVAVVKDERHRPREIIGFATHSNIHRNVGISWLDAERAILLGNAEAHRFALQFQKKQRK